MGWISGIFWVKLTAFLGPRLHSHLEELSALALRCLALKPTERWQVGWDLWVFPWGDLKHVLVEFQSIRSGFHEGRFKENINEGHWKAGLSLGWCGDSTAFSFEKIPMYPFIGVLEQLSTKAQRFLFTSRKLVEWCGCDTDGLECYGQAAKLLRQRFQALKTKRGFGGIGNGCLFFWGKD